MASETILVVEDNIDILALVRAFLENAGYTVLTAADGKEGLRVYEQHQSTIGLLLTDMRMPNMNGLDLAHRVLQLDSQLPVLFMSGDAAEFSRGFGCIPKPFRRLELVGRIRRILDSSSSRKPIGNGRVAWNCW